MPQQYYNDIKGKKKVTPNVAHKWIEDCIVGNIRKFELDNERMKETNALDMMQNSSIIYHTESILEMQMCCLIAMILLTVYWADKLGYNKDKDNLSQSMMLMYVLIAEHILSYLFGLFRNYDIDKNGKKNKRGIESAPRESALRIFEIIVDLGISVWILVSMLSKDSKTFNSLPLLNFWIMCDMIIMMITLPYTYISKFMMINGEITKNIFTLYQVQKRKLKERREANLDKNSSEWKSFFIDQQRDENIDDLYKSKKRVKSMMISKNKDIEEVINKKKKKKEEKKNKEKKDQQKFGIANEGQEDDETSDSSSESSSEDGEDENELLIKNSNSKHEIIVREEDFEENEKLSFSQDVYNFTICANMTKCCSPLQQGFALKQCFIVFGV